MSHLVPMRMKTEVCASFFLSLFFLAQSYGHHWDWREMSDCMAVAF